MITLQLSPHTDHITDDGTELTKRPYPFHVDAEGNILDRRGEKALIGFQIDAAIQRVDIWWDAEYLEDPQQAIGMYAVTQDDNGQFATQVAAIESVEVTP